MPWYVSCKTTKWDFRVTRKCNPMVIHFTWYHEIQSFAILLKQN